MTHVLLFNMDINPPPQKLGYNFSRENGIFSVSPFKDSVFISRPAQQRNYYRVNMYIKADALHISLLHTLTLSEAIQSIHIHKKNIVSIFKSFPYCP